MATEKVEIGKATLHWGDCLDLMKATADKTFDLAIVDPPYFEVKGEFDFVWPSFDAYLDDVRKWAKELRRIMKDSGSVFWWGNCKNIAYSQIILDEYFNLENSMIWEKKDSMQYQYYSPALARSFNTHTERLLYYSCEKEMTGREFIESEYIAPRNPFALYLTEEFKRAGVSNKQIAALFPSRTGGLTGCVSNWLNGTNVITPEQYQKIREFLGGDYLRREYDELRREYDELRRPFNNELKLTDVLSFSQQSNETRQFPHPTQKAPRLSDALVMVTGKPGGTAFIPFVGSGTEVISCLNFGMNVIGCELNPKYFAMAAERIRGALRQQSLFAAPAVPEQADIFGKAA
jgi:site-specific DNA-methyltransferase (adenine-specific)